MYPIHPQDLARMQEIEADIALQTGKPVNTVFTKDVSSQPSDAVSTQDVPMQPFPLFMSSAPTTNVSIGLE